MATEWRDVDDLPNWGDHGPAEFMREDGTIVRAELFIDAVFTGEDEVPLPTVVMPDESEESFFDFARWRLLGSASGKRKASGEKD